VVASPPASSVGGTVVSPPPPPPFDEHAVASDANDATKIVVARGFTATQITSAEW
jgi:hypothetical protein